MESDKTKLNNSNKQSKTFNLTAEQIGEDKCENDCVLVNLLLEVRSGLGNLTSVVVAHSQGLRIVN